MTRIALSLWLGLLTSVAQALPADVSPFIGTWKSDEAKSHNTGDVLTYLKTGTGYKRKYGAGYGLEFATDGKEYKDDDGYLESWTAQGPNAWQATIKMKGKLVSTRHVALSADGNTMTVQHAATLPDGTQRHSTDVRARVGSGAGLAGDWKSIKYTGESSTARYSQPRPGWLRSEELGTVVEGPTDGSEFAMNGADVPPGWVASFKAMGSQEIAWSGGFKGKPEVKGTSTVSADGKTLTVVSWTVGRESEKSEAWYDKQ